MSNGINVFYDRTCPRNGTEGEERADSPTFVLCRTKRHRNKQWRFVSLVLSGLNGGSQGETALPFVSQTHQCQAAVPSEKARDQVKGI